MLIHPYSADWNTHFELIKYVLDKCFQGLDYTIEHVGSTAVPGLAAKPIKALKIERFLSVRVLRKMMYLIPSNTIFMFAQQKVQH